MIMQISRRHWDYDHGKKEYFYTEWFELINRMYDIQDCHIIDGLYAVRYFIGYKNDSIDVEVSAATFSYILAAKRGKTER